MRLPNLLPRDRGTRALRLSLFFCVLEVLIWLILGLVWARLNVDSNNKPVPLARGIVAYAAAHLGEITIGVATTAYVIFTYQMLLGAEVERRRQSEPYLHAEWGHSATVASVHMPRYAELGGKTLKLISDVTGFKLKPDEVPATPKRYLQLTVSNKRDVPLEWLRLSVAVSAEIPRQDTLTESDRVECRGLNLKKDKEMAITISDLGPIPKTARVTVRVEQLEYGPAEAEISTEKFGGDDHFQTDGEYVPVSPRAELAPSGVPEGGQSD
jgi:hypothetical protein